MTSRECLQHPKVMIDSLQSLRNVGLLCDVTILTNDEKIRAHRVVLVAASKYFQAMLLNDTKESNTGIIDFPDTPDDIVRQCINFIYTGQVTFSLENIDEFMKACDMMCLTNLTGLYVKFLSENIDLDNICEILKVMRVYNEENLKEPVKEYLRNQMHYDATRVEQYNRCIGFGDHIGMIARNHGIIAPMSPPEKTKIIRIRMKSEIGIGFFVASSDRSVYILGGTGHVQGTAAYQISFGDAQVKNLSRMIYPRSHGIGVWYRDTLYAVGGGCDSAEYFNSITEQWQIIPNLKISCVGCKAHISGKLYIFGGTFGLSMKSVELEKLDIPDDAKRPALRIVDMRVLCASFSR